MEKNAPRNSGAGRAIAKALGDLAVVRAVIAGLETKVADGVASAAQLDLLARRRGDEEDLVDSLSLPAGKGIRFDPVRADFTPIPTGGGVKRPVIENVADAPEYEKWLQVRRVGGNDYRDATAADLATLTDKPAGALGFRVALTVDGAMYDLLTGSPPAVIPSGSKAPSADRFVFYRRPVNVQVSVAPCGTAPLASAAAKPRSCTAASNAPDDTEASETVAIPQLSGLYSLSIGGGGLFGTREAKVELDENGAPTALEYGSGSGGAEVATVLDSGLTAATTLRDARSAATQRKINAIKAEKELDELLSGTPE
ncbi:MAG: hypothetical protein WDN24_14610 [Sphingomonas sp.]